MQYHEIIQISLTNEILATLTLIQKTQLQLFASPNIYLRALLLFLLQ
jgi:hypothetical protein